MSQTAISRFEIFFHMTKLVKIKDEVIIDKIYLVRGVKVMLDSDLAELYNEETRRLNEQVRRNISRFPKHFMFQLNKKEFENLKSQFATSSWGGSRKLPFAFTEHGVMQAATVLKSKRAVQMSIRIIEVFIKMREMLSAHKDILLQLEQLEKQISNHDESIQIIFDALKQLLNPKLPPRNPVGFKIKSSADKFQNRKRTKLNKTFLHHVRIQKT